MFLTDNEYNHVIDLLENKISKSPLLEDFQKWFDEKYKIKLYDYICDTTDELIRLRPVLYGFVDHKKMKDGYNYDKIKQREIRNKFSELSKRYECHKEYQNPDEVFVSYETIQDEIAKRVVSKAKPEIEAFSHEDIWKIVIYDSFITIFYMTDEQVERHQIDGMSQEIRETFYKILEPYDYYKIFEKGANCEFTSKQTLDEKYHGNLFFYFH